MHKCTNARVGHFHSDQGGYLHLDLRGGVNLNLNLIQIKSKLRCEECPLLEDEDDISDEEMEQLVSISPPDLFPS